MEAEILVTDTLEKQNHNSVHFYWMLNLWTGDESHSAVSFIHFDSLCVRQKKYKDEGRREMTSPLYSQLPETSETQFAREMTEIQSKVRFFRVVKTCFLTSLCFLVWSFLFMSFSPRSLLYVILMYFLWTLMSLLQRAENVSCDDKEPESNTYVVVAFTVRSCFMLTDKPVNSVTCVAL